MRKHLNGACPACGDTDFVLAEETVRYTDVKSVDGQLQRVAGTAREEPDEGEEAVRLFCSACGEYITVPKELQ